MKGLGTKQKEVLRELRNSPERYIQVVEDSRDLSSRITISDDDLNDYQDVHRSVLKSLLNRGLIKQSEYSTPSLDITIVKYKLA